MKRDDSLWLEELNIKEIGAATLPEKSAARHFGGVICNIQITDFEFFGFTESMDHESFDVELGFQYFAEQNCVSEYAMVMIYAGDLFVSEYVLTPEEIQLADSEMVHVILQSDNYWGDYTAWVQIWDKETEGETEVASLDLGVWDPACAPSIVEFRKTD